MQVGQNEIAMSKACFVSSAMDSGHGGVSFPVWLVGIAEGSPGTNVTTHFFLMGMVSENEGPAGELAYSFKVS